MALAMNWEDQGGFLANDILNKRWREVAQPLMKFRQFCSIKEAFGKNKGENVNWDKAANVSTRGGSMVETNTFNQSDIALSLGTLSVNEYGNSIPYTDKGMTLSQVDFEAILRSGLMNDQVKVIDGLVERQFNATPLRYVGTATASGIVTTNGTATATCTGGFKAYHLRQMVTELETRNVPGYASAGGDYVAILSTEAHQELFADLESLNKYVETGHTKIAAGEVGRYYNCRIVKDSYASRFVTDAEARTEAEASFAGLSGSKPAYIFGSDTCREAIVVPEQVRKKVVTDYGRSKGLAWYWLGGFKIEWDDAPNARIIKWDSA